MTEPHITIIGSGIGGLCMAIQLRRANINNFEIIEKAADIGGTWRDNTYPGCACDVPSHLYSYSFEVRPDWSRMFPPREEIFDYLTGLATKYNLYEKTRFNTEVTSITYDEATQKWQIKTADNQVRITDIVVSALGQLNRPKLPNITGQDEFKGIMFHSAQWEHHHDLNNKQIAVIGNGPSSAQFIPEIARIAKKLTVFQRSPCHIVPRRDKPYSATQKMMFKYIPGFVHLYRSMIYWSLEKNFTLFNPALAPRFFIKILGLNRDLVQEINHQFEEQVKDKKMQKILRPDYPVGCKRVVIADDYYPALMRDNVHIETQKINEITPEGINVNGQIQKFDTIIYGTGFASTDFLAPIDIIGKNQTKLKKTWDSGAEAYLGITIPDFPNFFMIYGPNTNLGHNSIIFMIECQTKYIISAIQNMHKNQIQTIMLRPEKMESFAEYLKIRLESSVWGADCNSWYKNTDGKIVNNWPDFTYVYREATEKFNPDDYITLPKNNHTKAA